MKNALQFNHMEENSIRQTTDGMIQLVEYFHRYIIRMVFRSSNYKTEKEKLISKIKIAHRPKK